MAAEPVLVSRVPGPRRREVGWWLYVAGSYAGGLCVVVWHFAHDPATRPWGIGITILLGVAFASTMVQHTWLDRERGRLLHRRGWVVRWELAWADARVVRLRHNVKGLVVLQVRGRSRLRGLHLPVVGDDERGPRGQPAEVLRWLAGDIRRCAPAVHHGVADELDAQADHLEAGGDLHDSPVVADHHGRSVFW